MADEPNPDLIEQAAGVLHGSYNTAMEAFNAKRGDDWMVVAFEDSRLFWRGVVEPLADAGLLHDHAECLEINQGWQAYKQRKIEERRRLTAERDALRAENEQLRAQIYGANLSLDTGAGRLNEARAERDRAIKLAGDCLCRIDNALSWLDEPDDATPEVQLAKIRAALQSRQL